MSAEGIVYLDNYLNKQIVICYEDCTKEDFCYKHCVSTNCLNSNQENFRVGEYVLINNKPTKVHIVKPKDTLQSIAIKYDVSVEKIKEKNKINAIFIGQQLFI